MAEFKLTHNPPHVHQTTGYSHAARIGDQIFASGQIARDEHGGLVGKGDPRAQTEQIYKNLKTVLEAVGSGLDLVGKITVYTTDLSYLEAIRSARNDVFGPIGHFPASTFLVISSLADPDYLVEIEAIAGVRG